jgi:hypothetical protein
MPRIKHAPQYTPSMSAIEAQDLEEYLQKMYKVAAGAQVTLNKRGKGADEKQRRWWDGYQQALNDVSDAVKRVSPPDQ